MKRIFAFLLLLLMLTMLFSACGLNNPSPADFYSDTPSDFYSDYNGKSDYILNTAEGLTMLSPKVHGNLIGDTSNLIIPFEERSSEIAVDIYNLKENKIIQSFTFPQGTYYYIESLSVFGSECFTLILGEKTENGMTWSTSLYTLNGEFVTKAEGLHLYCLSDYSFYFSNYFPPSVVSENDASQIVINWNLICFDNAVYRVSDDGSIKEVIEKSSFPPVLPSIDFYNGEYYIAYTHGDSLGFVVYDHSLEIVSDWNFDRMMSGNYDHNFHILNNGNVVFQLNEELPETAKKYDILIQGRKYKLTTLLINPKNGSEKNLQPNFIIENSTALDGYYYQSGDTLRQSRGIANKYKNMATVRYIKDGNLGAVVAVALTNQCKIHCELFTDFHKLSSNMYILPFSDDLYVYNAVTKNIVFVNGKGEKVMEMSSDTYNSLKYNNRYIVFDGCTYDHSFQPIYDFGADGYTLHNLMSDGMILSKDGDYYFCKDKTTTLIVTDEDINCYLYYTAHPDYYVVYDSMTREYTYFNARGEKLVSVDSPSIIRHHSEGYLLFEVHDDEGRFFYYRVSK